LATPASPFTVFADESGTHSGDPCYGIGALVIPASRLGTFNAFFEKKKQSYASGSEPCWSEIDKSYGDMNLAIDLLKAVLRVEEARYSAIVVRKSIYRKWVSDKVDGFWTSYHFLLTQVARLIPGSYHVILDPRSDPYPFQNEVLEIVGNNVLRKLPAGGLLQTVQWGESASDLGIQAVDLLTGAIVCSHNIGLIPSRVTQAGKKLLIKRLSAVLGWPDMFCDTLPNSKFNIWHFPDDKRGTGGWRAFPESRAISPNHLVPPVSRAEIDALAKS
jgi:hypothetical protein